MIVVRLCGGLGNQLFQYAAGRRLAQVRRSELVLDLGWYRHTPASNTPRAYELARYPIQARPAQGSERFWCALHQGRILRRLPLPRRWRHVRERGYDFDARILDLPDGVYLDGYWQSHRYFADIADTLRRELEPVEAMGDADREVAAHMQDVPNAVCLHVRRGDYVSNPQAARFHGVCGLDYYERAVGYLMERLLQPHFFVFSDDMPWVRAQLRIAAPVRYVDHNGPQAAFQDLRLMSRCRHHVVANSSFSWWAAWLAAQPAQQVIAPRAWFADGRATPDLIPPEWVRL
ncbi:MAG: alpha-1,2-fucosyltransferase [Hylemonella sp.]